MRYFLFTISFLLLLAAQTQGQSEYATVHGQVIDSVTRAPLENAFVVIQGQASGSSTDEYGKYSIAIPSDTPITLLFSYQGIVKAFPVKPLKPGTRRELNVQISIFISIPEAGVTGRSGTGPGPTPIKPKDFARFSSPNSGVEALLKTLPGVSGNNELSSAFSVRGGNYDENLIYVNDVEIYRPQLIRSGQQEGQSFINPDMVKTLRFSAGGFSAVYGDKMSSVLDIDYRLADSLEYGVRLSMLGASAYIGNKHGPRFRYLVGARYRSNAYLLGSLDVQGNYKPRFMDIQALVSYDLHSRLNLSYLGSIARNQFNFVPESQTTSFGTVTEALQLTVFFNGGELMRYTSTTNALTLRYTPNNRFQVRWINSLITSNEREFYTVEGAYRLDELDKDLGSATFGQAKFNRGAGYFINHARNQLNVLVFTSTVKAAYYDRIWNLKYGVEYRSESIRDVLNEWVYNDSVDYSVPFNHGDSLKLFSTIRSKNNLVSNRYAGYVEQTWELQKDLNMELVTGVRMHYWDMNGQVLVSPRVQFSFEPNKSYNKTPGLADSLKKRDYHLWASWGVYYQPPFYREMRDLEGAVNRSLKAQRAIHYVLGTDFFIRLWKRPFLLRSEIYYKQLDHLVPYLYDNVRIRYYASNSAKGYATGIDTRINGEFIKGLESWFSLSVMQTREKITYVNDQGLQVTSPYLRRPTDQRVNLGIFFQDELRNRPEYKVSLNFVLGTGMPYFLTGDFRYTDQYKIPPYRRVDIGFSRELIESGKPSSRRYLRHVSSAWISLDVFNLLGVDNVASYIWVRDVVGQTFAVPNYLTSRRINLNLVVNF